MKAGLALFLAVAAASPTALAQLAPDSKEPIDITAETAEFQNDFAVWIGDVRVVQGPAILTTDRLEATLNDAGDFEIIEAFGAVRYSSGDEAIMGDHAIYTATSRTIMVTSNVVVTQGKQVMSAGAVTYWIDTGKVRFQPAQGSRIRGIFFTDKVDQKS